jgi:HK97 family phage portal protein
MRLPKFLRRSRSEPVSQEDLAKWFGGGESWSGMNIDRTTSLGLSAVWACVRLISESVASLPLILYRRTEKGKERAVDHPLFNVFRLQPNPESTSFQWREVEQGHLLLQGNCYSQIVLGGDGYVDELWPLDPERMVVRRLDGKVVYEYNPHGSNARIVLPRDQVLHVAGLGYDGIKGYAVLELLANTIGAVAAADRYGAEFFKNEASPGGYIKLAGALKDDAARTRLRDSWEDMHGKWGNKRRVGVLEQGAEFNAISIPPEQAQFIETRKYGTSEISRIFGVPPHMIGDVERSTSWGTGIEQQGIGFVVNTLRPWLVRWEQALTVQVLPEKDRGEYFFEFLVDALMRGDMQARWTAYRTAREIGILSANDVRELENMNDIENGDDYFVPMNWMTVENAQKAAPPGATKDEPPSVEEPDPEEDPESAPDGDEEAKSARELRSVRSAASRKKIADAHRAVVREASGRAIHRETGELRAAAKKMLRQRSTEEWQSWLEKFYRDEYGPWLYRVMAPALEALAGSVRAAVADEMDMDIPDTPEIEKAIRGYIGSYVQRHGAYSRTVLESALRDLQKQDPVDVVEGILSDWEEKRPERIANNETVGASNSYAKTFYRSLGVLSLVWMNTGSDSCPFCTQMNGKTVGIDQEFAMTGDALLDESGKLLEVQRKMMTPPLHTGCVCQIAAGGSNRGRTPEVSVVRKRVEIRRDDNGDMVSAEIVEE